MTIRNMTPDDYNDVYCIWINTPGMGLNQIDDSKDGITKYLQRNPTTCFVALDEDCIVGAILSGHDGRRGYISHTAVVESYRGRGIGKALVSHVIEAMRGEGIIKLVLVVFTENDEGNAFWEKCGFTTRPDLIYRNRKIAEF